MKKYMIFISSFAALYLLLQISSGAILTLLFKPDLSSVQAIAGQEVVIERTSSIPFSFIFIFLSSTIAYYLSQKSGRNSNAKNAILRS
ncbi:hypothetical protein [Sporosarcina sp. JAI121]|uniref:hypothetical protein n=1 Tax=Sporosarcina sp. JAI121 TaxID=2723064 RepID=UPI0015CBF49D|nr:hypothetical protein [Sporosarcina sp. JAI121]NYF23193.1 hypothetical protein [Sporosarcina sp. JAI121]